MAVDMELLIGDLALSVDEAADTLRAIRAGEVDAVVVHGKAGDQVYTFRDPSHPFRMLVEAMGEGAALVTQEGVVSYHNPRFAELLDDEPATGRTLSALAHEEDTAAVAELLAQARSGPARRELRLASDVPVLMSVSSVEVAGAAMFCIVATDLRAHRLQEERYRTALVDIEKRDRALAIAAHELRGPLNVLSLRTHQLRTKLGVTASAPVEKALDAVVRQGKRLTELVEKLLDVGSIVAGKMPLVLEELDLADEVKNVVERSRSVLEESGSTLTMDLKPTRGRWDRVRLEQVIGNLLSNAAKYGSGKPVFVFVDAEGDRARFGVVDQGVGISPDERERIFRPYEQMKRTAAPGLGLGLYITAEIVKALGGEIKLESEAGRGSRFVVELPRTT